MHFDNAEPPAGKSQQNLHDIDVRDALQLYEIRKKECTVQSKSISDISTSPYKDLLDKPSIMINLETRADLLLSCSETRSRFNFSTNDAKRNLKECDTNSWIQLLCF